MLVKSYDSIRITIGGVELDMSQRVDLDSQSPHPPRNRHERRTAATLARRNGAVVVRQPSATVYRGALQEKIELEWLEHAFVFQKPE